MNRNNSALSTQNSALSKPMIRCLPKGVCSWNFILEGDGILAELTYGSFKEKGTIVLNGYSYEVNKPSMMSGEWTLTQAGREIATARKESVFKRTFSVTMGLDEWQLRAESSLGRSFLIVRSNKMIGQISPMHPFTRRAKIEMVNPEYDGKLVAFSFWLVALMWRRAASSS